MVKPMVKQVVPLQPMKDHGRADIHTAACGGPPATAGGHALNEMRATVCHTGTGSWWELQLVERSPCSAVLLVGPVTP